MRDRSPLFLRLALCAGIAACALSAALPVRADDLFGPEPATPDPKPALQCPAGISAGPDLQSRIAEIQRQITVKAGGDLPPDGSAVMLNGSGYNYGGGGGVLDQAAINFEAKQTR